MACPFPNVCKVACLLPTGPAVPRPFPHSLWHTRMRRPGGRLLPLVFAARARARAGPPPQGSPSEGRRKRGDWGGRGRRGGGGGGVRGHRNKGAPAEVRDHQPGLRLPPGACPPASVTGEAHLAPRDRACATPGYEDSLPSSGAACVPRGLRRRGEATAEAVRVRKMGRSLTVHKRVDGHEPELEGGGWGRRQSKQE